MSTLYVNNIEPVSGSSLTLISASLVAVDNLTVTSLTSSFQGDLQGTASFATTASHALNSTAPGGVEGQVQFNSGSSFGADSNLFWDNTNKRLGIGTNAPGNTLRVVGSSRLNNIYIGQVGNTVISNTNSDTTINLNNGVAIAGGSSITPTARLHVKGSGSTSATTALLVQNSAGTNWLQVKDDGDITNGANGSTELKFEISPVANKFFRLSRQSTNVDFYSGSGGNAAIETSGGQPFSLIASSAYLTLSNGGVRIANSIGTTNSTAQLEIVSTTQGFLPPRMTTTQKNAISTPAAGLMVYDTTLNQMSYYNGTSWVNF